MYFIFLTNIKILVNLTTLNHILVNLISHCIYFISTWWVGLPRNHVYSWFTLCVTTHTYIFYFV